MKAFLSFALLTLVSSPVVAQSAPGWAWLKTVTGRTNTTAEWNNCADIGRDAVGNVYVAGTFVGVGTFDANAQALSNGEADIFLAKYSPAGSLIWLRLLQGTGNDKLLDLAVDAAGNTAIAGQYGELSGDGLLIPGGQVLQGPQAYGAPAGSGNYSSFPFLASFDAQGNTRWATRVSPTYRVGSPGQVNSLALSPRGEVYWSSNMGQDMLVNGQAYPRIGSNQDAFLVSYGPNGQFRWLRQVAGTSTVYGDAAVLDRAGYLYWSIAHANQTIAVPVGGTTVQSSQNTTLLKLAPSGATKWLRAGWPATGPNNPVGRIVGTDSVSGSLLVSVSPLQSQTVTFAGSTVPAVTFPTGQNGSILARSDTSGRVTWAKIVALNTATRGSAILKSAGMTADGGVVATVSVNFQGSYQLPPPQSFDPSRGLDAVLKYQPGTDTFAWMQSFGVPPSSTQYTQVGSMAVDPNGSVYLAGQFLGIGYFGPFSANANSGRMDGFVAKLDPTLVSTRPRRDMLPWSVYPNPATGMVQITGLPPRTELQLLDCLGRTVRTLQTTVALTTVSLEGLPAGVYFVQPSNQRFTPSRLLVR